MKHLLEPLARTPGVRLAALVTPDGVPIAVQTSDPRESNARRAALDADALAALSTGWIGEVQRAIGPLSWDAPRHLVLRAARGTLVLMQAPGALLVVVLDSGTLPAELRLSMESAVSRMQRHLRGLSARAAGGSGAPEPPSALPSRVASPEPSNTTVPAGGIDRDPATGNEDPELSGG